MDEKALKKSNVYNNEYNEFEYRLIGKGQDTSFYVGEK
jgi:hypothetical protein